MTNTFVITSHQAEKAGPHHDLYLSTTEDGITFMAWALPKGFPTTKGDKRLAVRVPDHSYKEATFEGEIEKGYGKGTKEIWDEGAYVPHSIINANGPIRIDFRGGRVQGTYYLKHWEGKRWLLWRS